MTVAVVPVQLHTVSSPLLGSGCYVEDVVVTTCSSTSLVMASRLVPK